MSDLAMNSMAVSWSAAIVAAAIIAAPPGFASLLPVVAAATLLPDRNRGVCSMLR